LHVSLPSDYDGAMIIRLTGSHRSVRLGVPRRRQASGTKDRGPFDAGPYFSIREHCDRARG